jgi:hypothetical protein
VEVGEGDTEVTLTIRQGGGKIGGQVGIESGAANLEPIGGVEVRFIDILNSWSTAISRTVKNDGLLAIPYITAGKYRIAVSGIPVGMYLAAIRDRDGRSVLSETIEVREGQSLNFTVALGRAEGVVRGTVLDRDGQPVPGSIVALVPELSSQLHLYRVANADENGVFQIESPLGSFDLYAWTELEGAAFRNSEFMRAYEGKGVSVKITEPGKGVDAALRVLD